MKCKERVCVEAVRISLGQMVSINETHLHKDLRRITGENHSKVSFKESVRYKECDDYGIKPKAFLSK